MKRIVIDAGHGKNINKSPINSSYYEGNVMWEIQNELKNQLEKYQDVDVIVTRPNLTDNPALLNRGYMAKGAEMFISLHSNAAASPTVTGSEIIISNTAEPEFYQWTLELKKAVNDVMGDLNNRSVYTKDYADGSVDPYNDSEETDYFGVLRGCQMVDCDNAIILEQGFHTNLYDTQWLMDTDNQVDLSKVIAEMIADFLGLKLKNSSTEKTIEEHAKYLESLGYKVHLAIQEKTPDGSSKDSNWLMVHV